MSLGLSMPRVAADALAKKNLSEDLGPHVERLQVVGSVRRRRPHVSAIVRDRYESKLDEWEHE